MKSSPLSIGFLSVALATLPVSAASAHDFHHHRFGLIGGVFGLAGAVVVGAVTIATAPLVILGDALSGGHRGRYYQRDGGYDGRGPEFGYEGSDGYGVRGAYARGQEYRYPPRRTYPDDGYAPSQDFYRGRSQPYPSEEAYNAPRRGYYPDAPDAYDPRSGERSPQSYYRDRRDYDAPAGDERFGDTYSGPPEQYGYGQDYGPPPIGGGP
jgi:hypothetical protein